MLRFGKRPDAHVAPNAPSAILRNQKSGWRRSVKTKAAAPTRMTAVPGHFGNANASAVSAIAPSATKAETAHHDLIVGSVLRPIVARSL